MTSSVLVRWYAISVSPLVIVRIFFIFLYSSFFLPDFVRATSISFHYSIIMKIFMIINIHMKFPLETFHDNRSRMTSRRRHFVFFTLSHIIAHIFLTERHFQNSFHRHKFQGNIYRYVHSWPRARHDARVRARQKLKMLKIQLWSNESTCQTILSIFEISLRARFCARFMRVEHVRMVEIPVFWVISIPDTSRIDIHSFLIISDK